MSFGLLRVPCVLVVSVPARFTAGLLVLLRLAWLWLSLELAVNFNVRVLQLQATYTKATAVVSATPPPVHILHFTRRSRSA
ncbi:hypothetical protein HaLaN_14633 [Haematococcus lacustris]|uniref:Uncharacterized protein n=1 Tax=Haematococcus lacustris TaxID=44745 RepID=A0A699ZEW2_HAELA|nr:hypothetical protein HaLaN_14633 [Haematococcus lacustris]